MRSTSEGRTGDAPGSVVLWAVWRARWLVLAAALVAGLGGYLYSSSQPTTYTATASFILSANDDFDPLGTGSSGGDSTRFVADQVSVVTSQPVLDGALTTLPAPTTRAQLLDSLDVTAATGADVITVRASAPTADAAAARANAVVDSYGQYVAANVQAQATAATTATTDAFVIDQVRTEAAVYGNGVLLVSRASAPSQPAGPMPVRDALVIAGAAALIAAAAALFRRRPRPELELEGLTAPVLGRVPLAVGPGGKPWLPAGEDFGLTLVALGYAAEGRPGPVLVTGASRRSHSPTVALGLATAAATRGLDVVVIDAEPRKREVLAAAGGSTTTAPVLESTVTGNVQLEDVLRPAALALPAGARGRVRVAALGGPHGVLQHDPAVEEALVSVGKQADLVLVHAGPLITDATAYALAGPSVGVLLVTTVSEAVADTDELQARLHAAGRPLLGLVIADPHRTRRAPRPAAPTAAAPKPAAGSSSAVPERPTQPATS